MSCAALIARIRQIGAPFGQELSIKLEASLLLHQRILLSLHRSAFGTPPLERIQAIAQELGAPETLLAQFPAALVGADIMHFGFEGGRQNEIYKVYFEYSKAARMALQAGKSGRVLVHRAFKWDRTEPSRQAVTLYSCEPGLTGHDLSLAIGRIASAPVARQLLQTAIDRARFQKPEFRPMALVVEEVGNPRYSLDINLYAANLCLHDVGDLMANAVHALAAPADRWEEALRLHGRKKLGHVAAGQGREGQPFVTVYFGVTPGDGAEHGT